MTAFGFDRASELKRLCFFNPIEQIALSGRKIILLGFL